VYNIVMPYSIGKQGSYGCSGYPVIKDGTGEVMGCHETASAAQAQISAINISESEKSGKKLTSAMGQPYPASNRSSVLKPARKRPRRRLGGVGGDSAGAVATTGGGTGMGTKSENDGNFYNPNPLTEQKGAFSGRSRNQEFYCQRGWQGARWY
jgi:hypothetical protein